MTTTRKYYALYNSYGIQVTGAGEQAHIFSDKKNRDKWVETCNNKAEERGQVVAKAITAKEAQRNIKEDNCHYSHKGDKVYEEAD